MTHRTTLVIAALVSFAIGCGPSEDIGSCPADATEADFDAAQQTLVAECSGCHQYDFGQLSPSDATAVFDQVGSGSMPPNRPLSDAAIEEIRTYLACTTDGSAP